MPAASQRSGAGAPSNGRPDRHESPPKHARARTHTHTQGKLPSSCPAIEQGSYTVSSTGRRLVHGDACEGVQSVIPDTDGKGSLNPGGQPRSSEDGSVVHVCVEQPCSMA
jgi:hypothetical protein